MHYAFDTWMDREFPGCLFERYADDIVAHCDTEEQARDGGNALGQLARHGQHGVVLAAGPAGRYVRGASGLSCPAR